MLGLSREEFLDLSPVELDYAFHYYYEEKKTNEHILGEWIRFHLIHMWNMSGKTLKPGIWADENFIRLPWDPKPGPQTPDQLKEALLGMVHAFKDLPLIKKPNESSGENNE